jgi:hypothetical protein
VASHISLVRLLHRQLLLSRAQASLKCCSTQVVVVEQVVVTGVVQVVLQSHIKAQFI